MFRTSFRAGLRFRNQFSRNLATRTNFASRSNYKFVGGSLALAGLFVASNSISNDNNVGELVNSVDIDSSVDPFPYSLNKGGLLATSYDILGFGVRSVTFVGFKVYAIAVYLANEDKSKAEKVLSTYSNLEKDLQDPDQSTKIVNELLENETKFAVRLSPVRNTDYNHLKDGFIKSILAHPKAKEHREEINRGLEELRNIFQVRRGTVPKNHVMLLQILNGGKLNFSYENTTTGEATDLGTVNEPLVANVLFLQYLSGKKPLSAPLKESCANGFASINKRL